MKRTSCREELIFFGILPRFYSTAEGFLQRLKVYWQEPSSFPIIRLNRLKKIAKTQLSCTLSGLETTRFEPATFCFKRLGQTLTPPIKNMPLHYACGSENCILCHSLTYKTGSFSTFQHNMMRHVIADKS